MTLYERLLASVAMRVNNGDYTERGLARIMGVSQPQIHNVLKGKRRLQTALADRIMQRFGIDVLDLLSEQELRERLVLGPRRSRVTTPSVAPTPAPPPPEIDPALDET